MGAFDVPERLLAISRKAAPDDDAVDQIIELDRDFFLVEILAMKSIAVRCTAFSRCLGGATWQMHVTEIDRNRTFSLSFCRELTLGRLSPSSALAV